MVFVIPTWEFEIGFPTGAEREFRPSQTISMFLTSVPKLCADWLKLSKECSQN